MKRAIIIALAIGLAVFVWAFDPVGGAIPYPRCPVKLLTGLDCPGCGSARALHSLLHGEIVRAWEFNPWLPVVAVMALLAQIGSACSGRLRDFIHSPATLGVFIALSLGWMALRNFIGI